MATVQRAGESTRGERPMSIEELQALLEATRQRIADQGRIVDSRLLDKEQMLEKAILHYED